MRKILIALLILVGFKTGLTADTLTVAVKFVSSTTIYVDGGSRLGLGVGDRGEIFRAGAKIGAVEIAFLSEKSASCNLIEKLDEVVIGDKVIFELRQVEQFSEKASTDTSGIDSRLSEEIKSSIEPTTNPRQRQFKGRAVFSSYSQDDLSNFDYDYFQPSLYLQGTYTDAIAPGAVLSWRLRLRRIDRGKDRQTEWENRLYEIAVYKEIIPERLTAKFGRFAFSESPGMGYIDGLTADNRINPAINVGGFAGLEPGSSGEALQSDRLKAGIYGRYQLGDFTTKRRLRTTAAIAGVYFQGEIEREFLYLSNDAVIAKGVSFYQSSDIEINRGWREKAEGSSLKISSIYFALRWEVNRVMGLTLGYDNRTPIRDAESRALPDSLFDEALRQGMRGGLTFRLPYGLRTGFDAGSNGATGRDNSISGSGYFGASDILNTGISGTLKYSGYKSDQTEGTQATAGLNRELFKLVNMRIDAGQMAQKWTAGLSGEGESRWVRLGGEVNFRRSFGALSYEWQRGDFGRADRMSLDIGTRF